MTQQLKVGDAFLELPAGSEVAFSPALDAARITAEKPETPEPLEDKPYIYRPNDPFQAQIDEARAIASIDASHKPWVKKTWFVLFVIGPLVYAQLLALSLTLEESGWEWFMLYLGANTIILPLWLVYYSIWRRKARKS